MLDQDWVKIGVEVGGMAVVGLSAFFAVRGQVAVLAVTLDFQARTIDAIKEEVSKIAGLIANQQLIDQRLARAEEDIRNLQRGEGYVLPITRGAYEHGGKT